MSLKFYCTPAKIKGVLWLLAAVVLAGFAVVVFSIGLRKIPRSYEAELGHKISWVKPEEVCHRPESVQALQELVKRIYPQGEQETALPVSVEVLRGGPVNAFASLGPQIYVYETLLTKAHSPDEVAGILAHEMGHVTERHVLDSLAFRVLAIPFWSTISGSGAPVDPRVIEALMQMKYSRTQEYEADVDGLERLKKAEIDTHAVGDFFARLKEISSVPAFLSDHPSSESRSQLANLYLVEHPKPALTDEQWRALRQICED